MGNIDLNLDKKKKRLSSKEKQKYANSSLEIFIQECHREVSSLSYEKSLEKLDSLLDKLQGSSLLVEDLQRSYIKANIYLEHCEKLLERVEQDVVEINDNYLGKVDKENDKN